ncbi:programmed cell death protein 1 [Paroedura picta]|uniref:programmed cell death protein 1 n=1 Tax=Paroedura picta TaxID=143630 RepID=UPI0040561284
MESPPLVVVIEVWSLLLFCQSAQVVNQSVTCLPSELTKPEGDSAVFTCKFADMNDSDYVRNLYREDNEGQTKKITELKGKLNTGKYSIDPQDLHTYAVTIVNLEKDDAGKYFCGLISISSPQTVTESQRSNLTVTEKASTTAEPALQEEEEEEKGRRSVKEVPLALIVGGAGLILGLAFLAFVLFKAVRRGKGERTRRAEMAPLEEEPPVENVFTVDYGILEFATKAPPKRPPVEKTEYATIVFPTCDKSPKQHIYVDRTQLP